MKRFFQYVGVDSRGRDVTGVVETATHQEADQQLKGQGIHLIHLFETNRILVIERSLSCYAFGWLSLLPLLGLFPAIHAIVLHQQVRVEAGCEWNPADRYLVCGYVLAWVGSFISLITLGLVVVVMLKVFGGA